MLRAVVYAAQDLAIMVLFFFIRQCVQHKQEYLLPVIDLLSLFPLF